MSLLLAHVDKQIKPCTLHFSQVTAGKTGANLIARSSIETLLASQKSQGHDLAFGVYCQLSGGQYPGASVCLTSSCEAARSGKWYVRI